MSDEELDALVACLRELATYYEVATEAASAITTLRAQLAVAEACNRGLVRLNEAIQARADRAEAALAAQIEADARMIERIVTEARQEVGNIKLSKVDAAVVEMLSGIAKAIRNQPHDRTALDRYREKALREAAQVLTDEIDLARIAMPQVVPILAADRKAILALIEKTKCV